MKKLFAMLAVLCISGDVLANRNSSGTYSLANPSVIPNQLITSSLWNSQWGDIGAEITDSLDRSGKGGMLAPLQCLDGTIGAPGITFGSELGLGDYRSGAGSICRVAGGVAAQCWTASAIVTNVGTNHAGPNVFAGSNTFNGTLSRSPITLTPQAAPSTPANGDVWIDTGSNRLTWKAAGVVTPALTSPIQRSDLPSVGTQTSSSSGALSMNGAFGSPTDFTNPVTVTITSSSAGRPILLSLQPDGTANPASMGEAGSQVPTIYLVRDGSIIARWSWSLGSGSQSPLSIHYLDTGAAASASHVYKFQMSQASGIFTVSNYVLVAYEL